jgi:hypothetical protein
MVKYDRISPEAYILLGYGSFALLKQTSIRRPLLCPSENHKIPITSGISISSLKVNLAVPATFVVIFSSDSA